MITAEGEILMTQRKGKVTVESPWVGKKGGVQDILDGAWTAQPW